MLIQRPILFASILLFFGFSICAQVATPPNCSPVTSRTFCNDTVYFIPDQGTIIIPILVSSPNTALYDLNVLTQITHTFPGDLDITLTSPSGTVATITTDNGVTNDNVFNGTFWDDSALIGVADNVYVNNVLASPLRPEEPFGIFFGENPNGVWVLTITDDLGGDVGMVTNVCLDIADLPTSLTQTNTSFNNNTPLPILDLATNVTTIMVAGLATSISDVNLTTFIRHTFAADLDITLTSPSGTIVTLTTDNGAGQDNVFNGTFWDDSANNPVTDNIFANLTLSSPLSPEGGLSAFIGENPNGMWTLTIVDDLGGDSGTLDSWSLDISTGACASIPTLSTWGILVLLMLTFIFGAVVIRQKQSSPEKKYSSVISK